ncbi:hypothetical protein AAG906_012169 [Vitis piasezkii]
MDSRQRKRRSYVPSRYEAVKLPKSRCLGKKFLSIMDTLPMDKKNAISDMGFGGLLQLGFTNYDIGYHRLCMETKVVVLVTPKYVREVLGIPDNGVDILIYNRRGTPNHTYNIKILEANLRDLPVGEEFMKSFLIFACATILASNSKQESMHDLWDTIWDSEVGVRKNWAKFVLQYVEDGIRDYRTSHPIYIRGCVLFLQLFYITKFYMTAFQVEVRSPLLVAWTDEQVKRHLAVIQGSKPSAHNDGRPYEMGCSHSDDPTETIEARLSRNSEHLMSLTSSVAQDIATLRARSSGGQSGCALTPPEEAVNVERKKDEGSTGVHPCSDEMMRKGTGAASTHSAKKESLCGVDDGPCIDHDTCPPSQKSAELQSLKGVQMAFSYPRRRFKHIAKRLVKLAAICKSPFILCDMHGTYITQDELSSLNGGRWVNSVIIGVVCRMMDAEQAIPPHAHYFDSSFFRCRMFLYAEFVGYDFSSCDMLFFPVYDNNPWHVHVVNIPASRVEILSSLPLRRGNGISVVSRRLSDAIDKAFHAHGMLRRLEVSKFHHVQPQIVQQLNGYDCGMFAIKYMEHWNEATLAHSIAEPMILVCVVHDKMHLYRLRLVVTLVTNVANNARDKVLKACRI